MPPFSFLASRTWLSVALLIPVVHLLEKKAGTNRPVFRPDRTALLGGLVCGFFLFMGSATQQIGIAHTTPAKSGFITAMYVVIVPVIYAIRKRGIHWSLGLSVVLAVTGLYLLCIKEGFSLGVGDTWTLVCAFMFSFQILCITHFVGEVGGVRLTLYSFFTEAILSTLGMLFFEHPTPDGFTAALPAILFAGIFSGCLGYTLQAIGQRIVNPATASLTMSLESVFGAIGGWIVLHQVLSGRELFGCVLMFAAILLAEFPALSGKT